jgi:peroxiredoxin
MWKSIFAMSVLFAIALTLQAGCTQKSSSESAPGQAVASKSIRQLDPYSSPLYPAKQDAPARDFTAELISGEEFTLSNHKGEVILLNIWATWCAPCHTETPEFVELYNEYRDQGLLVLGVSIDEQGKSVVQPFVEKYNVTYPIIIDDGSIMEKYGPTMGIPTTYVIDKKGNLRYFAVGPLTLKELTPRIEQLLEEPV